MATNNLSPLFSNNSDDWETHDLFQVLDKEFNFTLDVAATLGNSKCSNYISAEMDALTYSWSGTCWCNCPYSLAKEFIECAYNWSLKGVTTVCIIPARTDTKYWHKWVPKASEVRFIKGRVKFIGASHGTSKNSAPFPSALVIFRGMYKGPTSYWCWDWKSS